MSSINVTNIKSRQGGAPTFPQGLNVSAGVATFAGNVSVAGTLTYDDVTNIDSVGLVTAGKGFRATTGGLIVTAGVSTFTAAIDANSTSNFGGTVTVSAGGVEVTGGEGVYINSGGLNVNSGLGTFKGDVELHGNQGVSSVTWDASANSLLFKDSSYAKFGTGGDLEIYHDGSNSHISDQGSGVIYLRTNNLQVNNAANNEAMISATENASVDLYYDNSRKLQTIGTGVSVYGALKLQNGLLRENVNRNTGTAANAATALNLDNGMVHWFTTNLGAANVKMNVVSGAGINTDLAVGDMISVTIMTAVNSTSNFIEQVRVDGVEASAGVTTYWTGGSAPSDGGGSGVDTYAFNIVKTGNATYDMIANQVKGS